MHKKIAASCWMMIGVLTLSVQLSHADPVEVVSEPIVTAPPVVEITPMTQEEMQQAMEVMSQKLNNRIKNFGNKLTKDDFEWTWKGRQLNKAKRQEVCGIFQDLIDDMYKGAVENKQRLSPADQKVIADRNLFIQKLGYQNNIVDTNMGFNCRLR